MNDVIYLDNAATTKVNREVFETMKPYFEEEYGNASSIYQFAGNAKKAIDNAREVVADFIGANYNEIYFTGSGSESDNWALKGIAYSLKDKGNHIITTKIEHHAVLHTCNFLEKHGFEVTYLNVDENGFVDIEQLKKAIKPKTILVSVMFANNEIGTIEPIKKIGEITSEMDIYLHTDAVQAYGHIPINVNELHIDMLSASGHKINGPKGVGVLYIRDGVKIGSLIHGGAQERSRRAGTHNTPGIVGFAKATQIAKNQMTERAEYEKTLRDYLIERVLEEVSYTKLNGDRYNRLYNNANFSFRFIEGESLLIMLDQKGICCSSGSACTSGALEQSHVLLAIGLSHEIANGSLRLTLSYETTKEEIDYVVEELKKIVVRLRSMSPLYKEFVKSQG